MSKNPLSGKTVVVAQCQDDLHNPQKNFCMLLEDADESGAFLEAMRELYATIVSGRGKRIVVTNVSADHSPRPGGRRILRGEILTNGALMSKEMGYKSPDTVARALWVARRNKPEAITGDLNGVEMAYVEDYDRQYGRGMAEVFSRGMIKEHREAGLLV